MCKTPYPHQEKGIAYGMKVGSGFLYMEPRTGKTLTMQRILAGVYPVLIIAPTTVLATWYSALLEEGATPSDIISFDGRYKGTVKEQAELLTCTPRAKYYLVNFEKVVAMKVLHKRLEALGFLNLSDWGAVVVDESYRIANPEASVTEYLVSDTKPAMQRRWVLSGYPIGESPLDIATQAIFTKGSYFGHTDPIKYRLAYWKWVKDQYKWVVKDTAHLEQIKQYIASNAYVCKMADLGLGGEILESRAIIPASSDTMDLVRWCKIASVYRYPEDDLEDEARKLTPAIRALFLQKVGAGIHPTTGAIFCDAKYEWVRDQYVEDPEPTLILSRFTAPIIRMQEVLTEAGIPSAIIKGSTPLEDREAIRADFQEGLLKVVIAQVKTVKMGLDFSALNRIVYINNSWSYDDRAQSVLRGQNVNRSTPYEVIDVCTQHTNDLLVSKALVDKKDNANKYLTGEKEL